MGSSATTNEGIDEMMSQPAIRNFGGAPARVVVVGGGVGALEVMLALRALAKERVSIDLVAPTREFVYRPLSVLEPFQHDDATPRFNLSEIAIDQGARHHLDSAEAVDTERRAVIMASGRELSYDVLVVAIGARQEEAIAGALTFGGAEDSRHFEDLLIEAERGVAPRIVFAVPPGVVWSLPLYELALNTADHLDARVHQHIELTLVTPEDAPLAVFGPQVTGVISELLAERGIKLETGAYPASVEHGKVTLVPHGYIEADRVVSLPRLEGPGLPGLPSDSEGFFAIDDHCLVHGLTDVYAIGDATAFPIKQGGNHGGAGQRGRRGDRLSRRGTRHGAAVPAGAAGGPALGRRAALPVREHHARPGGRVGSGPGAALVAAEQDSRTLHGAIPARTGEEPRRPWESDGRSGGSGLMNPVGDMVVGYDGSEFSRDALRKPVSSPSPER